MARASVVPNVVAHSRAQFHKILLGLFFPIFIGCILIVASGSPNYVPQGKKHYSASCNFGYSGIPFIFLSPIIAVPYFIPRVPSVVTMTVLWSTVTVILGFLWIVLAYTPSYYDFRNASSGNQLLIDRNDATVVDAACYNGFVPQMFMTS
jgi:hypothetical protein